MADSVCHAPPIFQRHYKLFFFSTETLDFLKQIIFLKLFNSVFSRSISSNEFEVSDSNNVLVLCCVVYPETTNATENNKRC